MRTQGPHGVPGNWGGASAGSACISSGASIGIDWQPQKMNKKENALQKQVKKENCYLKTCASLGGCWQTKIFQEKEV